MRVDEFLRLLWQMWAVYWTTAWPFAIVHALLIWMILRGPVREIGRETRALRDWREDRQAVSDSECGAVLREFVEESAQWGPQGILVPMTDFTDRLDSHITGLIDNLHSRVNLFLVVGIAGTFYAMFLFAAGAGAAGAAAQGAVSPETGRLIADLLLKALAQAFPVGFFGLVYTILGHFYAFRLDHQLRAALTMASRRAMAVRRRTAKGTAEAITQALAPLNNLEHTLRDSLQPVIAGFRDQLDSTAKLIESQFQPLAAAVSAFKESADNLREPAVALTEAARALPEALAKVQAIEERGREHLDRMLEAEQAIRRGVDESATRMREATEGLVQLPSQLEGAFADSMRRMNEQAAALWCASSQSFFEGWKAQSGDFIRFVEERMELVRGDSASASQHLAEAARKLEELAAAARAVLEKAFETQMREAVRQLEPVIRHIEEAVAVQYPKALENIREATRETGRLSEETHSASGAMSAIANRLLEARGGIAEAQKALNEAAETVRRREAPTPRPDVTPYFRSMIESLDRIEIALRHDGWFHDLLVKIRPKGRAAAKGAGK